MKLTIRERGQRVAQYLWGKGKQSIRAIARATSLSTSSAYRHQQGIERRAQHPESDFWETAAGSGWLKVLVLGVVYYFGIKQGVGAESLSEFLSAVRLDGHVGSSASALRSLKREMKQSIQAYKAAQESQCQPQGSLGICVGGDETFFGLPVLVLMELASGYLMRSVECDNRTYQTWLAQIQQWWSQTGWQCHFMVSDGAQALIKLALSGIGCGSVADLFHALRGLGRPIGSAIGRQMSQLKRRQDKLQERYDNRTEQALPEAIQQAMALLSQQWQEVKEVQQQYHDALHAITQAIHPFELSTLQWQMFSGLSANLSLPLEQLSSLAQRYGGDKAQKAIDTFQQQIPSFAQGIHAWWQWVSAALPAQTEHLEIQQWVLTVVLPWTYWDQQADKTRQPELKQRYRQAADQADELLLAHTITQQIDDPQRQQWIEWAQWMCSKYQRTSSAVEGRNGYLSRLHHTARGFSAQTLEVLTIIHNFDLKRADGTTAAQRLFGHPFPDLFDWIVEHMGELPLPRRSPKAQPSNPLYLLDVSA
jgi:hypothetical protein